MITFMRTLLAVVLVGAAGCSAPLERRLSWSFDAGDCASNAVTRVRIDGVGEFDCSAGSAVVPESGAFSLAGLDENGAERFRAKTSSLVVVLRPKQADVTVRWSFPEDGTCAEGLVVPYVLGLYEWPGSTTEKPRVLISEVESSCDVGSVVFRDVAPGKYVIDLKVRMLPPDIAARHPLTVTSADDLTVAIDFP